MALAVFVCRPLARQVESATATSASGVYLALAINDAFCGRYASMSSATSLAPFSVADQMNRPISAVLIDRAGSVKGYCGGAFQPFVMNEISLAILEGRLLRIMPDASLPRLATVLAAIRVGLIAMFGFVLLRANGSLWLTFFTCLAAHYLTALLGGDALFSLYPFILPLMLGYVACCAILGGWLAGGKGLLPLGMAALLGIFAAFAGNLRTSVYPMAAVAFGVTLLDYLRRHRFERSHLLRCGALLAVFAAAVIAFEWTYISPMRRVAGVPNSPSHTIAHPLVLGLAAPPNALAAREGIEWDDAAGTRLARRIDPAASYLNPGYEAALFGYYRRLWRDYPNEMASIYVRKWRLTGLRTLTTIISPSGGTYRTFAGGLVLAAAILPIAVVSLVIGLPQVLLAMAVGAFVCSLRLNPKAAVLLVALPTIAFLGYIEAAVILPTTTIWYNGVLLAATVFLGLLTYQIVVDWLTWRPVFNRAVV